MPRFSANLTHAVRRARLSRPLRGRRARPASPASSMSAPTISARKDRRASRRHGLSQVLFNLPPGDWAKGERGIAVLPDRVEEFRAGVDTAIRYAEATGCSQVNCLAGIAPTGADRARLEETLVANLAYAADEARRSGIRLLAEPINTRDIPGFFLTGTRQALALFERVGSDNLYLQYDIYHMQVMEGDLARTDRGQPRPHRPRAAGRQSRPARAGHGRDQLSVPVPPSRPSRLRRLGRRRIQAGGGHRRRVSAG